MKTAAETFVANPGVNVAEAISQLAVGEALVSTLQEKGIPMPVERAFICPPACRMGALTPEERSSVMLASPVGMKYTNPVNRESAHEILARRAEEKSVATADAAPAKAPEQEKDRGALGDLLWGSKKRQGMVETMAKQAARTVGSKIGGSIFRGILGGIFGGKR